MVYLPPPQLAGNKPSYLEAYNRILASHRRSPLSSASSVIMLVTPNVDALCASRMFASLLKQDDVIYRIIPVSGPNEFENITDELRENTALHTLLLINMGGQTDLPSANWFGSFEEHVTFHVIDSIRPFSLDSLFTGGTNGDRIVVWDDGGAENIVKELKMSWEIVTYTPRPSDGGESEDEDPDEDEERSDDGLSQEDGDALSDTDTTSNKRRKIEGHAARKRRRIDNGEQPISRNDYDLHLQKIDKYYMGGTWHGQSAAGAVYILATLLERVDNDFLWLAILGLTYQYITSRISRDTYETYHAVYYDEVSRLNPQPPDHENGHLISINPDDISVRTTEELRFMLFRHWTLYDAMFHSSYVAGKLGIWKEKGRQKLTGLLAKMGFSIPQTQQPYPHMDMDLKKILIQKLNDVAPEYGLVELSYPSFIRCYGFHSQPLSAADAVEGINALLAVAEGTRMEVEVQGTRNGGEWFGAGRIWEVSGSKCSSESQKEQGSGNASCPQDHEAMNTDANGEVIEKDVPRPQEIQWWVKNFWTAYDSLTDIVSLRKSLSLSMSLQRSIISQGTSIIDKRDIKTLRNHRVVVLTQGPNLALFCHAGVLTRLALWLVDALRDRLPGTVADPWSKKKVLPVVVACLNEGKGIYTVVGVMAALEYGQISKNHFALAFLNAGKQSKADVRYGTFDSSVVEVAQADLNTFLQALCE